MKVETVVFLSLVLDLFGFTLPLPLFPRIIQFYTKKEASDPNGLLSTTLRSVSSVRGFLLSHQQNSEKWDIVLLGGLLGSVFSALQFFIAPHLGALSDKYGRKNVLLATMFGNILSGVVWLQSTTFASYMLSRVIGGLSEGNVQLAIAILSDVTTPATRSRALAQVGIAFSICFCIGPPIGAAFAARSLPSSLGGYELNVYAVPAAISVVLLVVETLFLAVALPETRQTRTAAATVSPQQQSEKNGNATGTPSQTRPAAVSGTAPEVKLAKLAKLRKAHCLFLALFSGIEFSLTFLTFDLFDWSNKSNGYLLGGMGILSALLQGGYVRRSTSKIGEVAMARQGVNACAIALALLSAVPAFVDAGSRAAAIRCLLGAAVCMAFTSATVVSALTASASLLTEDPVLDPATGAVKDVHPELAKGKALGQHRSSGQLGRAVGPLIACGVYWTLGPLVTYSTWACMMFGLSWWMRPLARADAKSKRD